MRLLDTITQKHIDDLSAIVSSFANTCGGLLFFGITVQRGVAKSFEHVSYDVSLDKLNYTLQSNIYPPIEHACVKSVVSPEIGTGVIAIKIPYSPDAPHMASDKRFYKRYDGKAVVMEEYEIRELYQKSTKPVLDFYAILNTNGVPSMEHGKFARVSFYPRFLVKNIGAAVERLYKVELFIPSGIYNANFTALQKYFCRLEDQYSVFSYSNESPLFQHELATVFEANLVVDKQSFGIFSKNDIIIKLYNSHGIKTKYRHIAQTFLYRNEQLAIGDFIDDFIVQLPNGD
jgi:hypothetical protein